MTLDELLDSIRPAESIALRAAARGNRLVLAWVHLGQVIVFK